MSDSVISYDADFKPLSVSYDRMIALAINAIKELNEENAELKLETTDLKLRIAKLESIVGISSSGGS